MPGSSTIVVRLVGDASSLRRDLNSATTGLQKFQARARLAAAAAVTAGVVMGKKAVEIASNTNEAMSKTLTVFGSSSKAVTDFAATSAKAYGVSKLAALNYASAMGAVQTADGVSRESAAKTSLVYTQLAADLASFYNTDIESAAQALTNSLTGEFEMMKRYGVVINEASLATEAHRQGLVKTGSTWTTAEKRALSYAIIMGQTSDAQGDAVRTGDQYAGQLKRMSAQFEDLQGKIGEKLLPVMTRLAELSLQFLGYIERNAQVIRQVTEGVTFFGAALVIGYTAMKAFAAWAAIATFATGGWATAFWGLNAAMAANPVGLIVVAVAAVAAGFVLAYKKLDGFRYAVNFMVQKVVMVLGTMAKAWLTIWGEILGLMGRLPGPLGAPFRAMAGAADAAIGKVEDLQATVDALPTSKHMDIIINIQKRVQEFNAAPMANGAGIFGGGTGGSIALNQSGKSAMQEYFDRQNKAAVDGANNVLGGLGSGIGGGSSGGGAGGGGGRATKTKPIKEAKKTGQEILDAFLGGLQSRFPGVAQKLSDWSDTIPKELGHGLDKVVKKTESAMTKVTKAQERNTAAVEKARQRLENARDAGSSFASSVRDSVRALADLGTHGGETFEVIAERLGQSLVNARLYASTMARLKAAGLSDAALQSLIASGPGNATTTGQAILAAGRAGIAQINTLTGQIRGVAEVTATKLADQFYGQGIRTAAGVLAGLKSKDAALKAQMKSLGDALVAAVRKGLNLKVTGSGLQVAGKRALGGPVTAGRTYLVGERGVERFTPSSSGRITPNDQLGASYVVELHGNGVSLEGLVEKVVIRRDRATVASLRAGASRRF